MARPRRNDILIPLLSVLSDFIAIVGAFYLSFLLRFNNPIAAIFPVTKGYPPINVYLISAVFIAIIWIFLFSMRKTYRSRREIDLSSELFRIIRIVSFGMLIVMSIAFLYRGFSYSRIVFGFIWGNAILMIFFGRSIVFLYEKHLYKKGKEHRNVLLVGTNTVAQNIALRISQKRNLGYSLIGYISDNEQRIESISIPRLGVVEQVPRIVERNRIETLIVCLSDGEREQLSAVFEGLIGKNVQILIQPEVIGISPTRLTIHELFGVPFLAVKDIPMTSWNRAAKRIMDLIVSCTGIVLFSPFGMIIMLLIRFESGMPIFYRQRRVGMDGREFTLYKFRTMRADAEEESGPTWTRKRDPRVTKIGRILRRLSLDEIPQFYNVLKGEMSIVGPRPERPEFVSQFRNYVPKYLERHRLKTGLTGWAQVNGLRGEVPILERTKYDLYYIENWSLRLDIRIILKTLRAVLFGKDAY